VTSSFYTSKRIPSSISPAGDSHRAVKARNVPIAVLTVFTLSRSRRISGSPIKDLPRGYLNWTLENLRLKGLLLKVLEAEFERRGSTP